MRFHLTTAVALVIALSASSATAEPIGTARLSCDVANTQDSTELTVRVKGIDAPVRFRIGWLLGKVVPANFKNQAGKVDRVSSTHQIGKITITRTILASAEADCILIHVIADQPGEVAFNARFLSEAPVKILDRREIVLSGGKIHAHAWIIPFESDVSDDGKGTITLLGEGEALILLNLTADLEKKPIAGTWTRLGELHDPGRTPPNPHLVWEAVKKTQDSETQDTRKE